ncbi:hypothetical protein [Aromatoleum evansii]|uniref:hypothetical protein n=1 Tax=Aromatoleum evansii TaxID=59406 RepID=UPI00145E4316|nr:hypothetical protein [Aromatoleum evansii]NMG28391.1 hypothetical protein [Aromatoleum evansii]
MAFLVENLPERVRHATLELGLVTSDKDRVPRRLAELLTLPLFDMDGSPNHETAILTDAAPPVIEAVDFAQLEHAEAPEKPEWTMEGILQLHSVLLEESLRALAARGNGEQKREILEWIFDPDLVGTVVRNGHEVPVYTWQVPWTFTFCCKLEGMDPANIRDHVLRRMPAAARKFFH